ncbi:hypothetical protein ACN47E_010302 [Coniothyrium glycines]
MEEPYTISTLNRANQEFRLLHLLPPSLKCQTLAFMLATYDISEYPIFSALSYEWGPESDYTAIQVNGVDVCIRENLWHFLTRWSQDPQAQFEPIWIDAICINQSNTSERNHQVRMMRQIYSRAQGVYIWLGVNIPVTPDMLQTMLASKLGSGKMPNWSIVRHVEQQLQTFAYICEASYWRRMWIVQEIVLAQDALICWDSASLGWSDFELLWKNIAPWQAWNPPSENHWRDAPPPFRSRWHQDRRVRQLRAKVESICKNTSTNIIKVKQSSDHHHRSLKWLLSTFDGSQCKDKRDKVYSLLGIATGVSQDFPVDYDKPTQDVISDVLDQMARIDVLGTPVGESQADIFFVHTLYRSLGLPVPPELHFVVGTTSHGRRPQFVTPKWLGKSDPIEREAIESNVLIAFPKASAKNNLSPEKSRSHIPITPDGQSQSKLRSRRRAPGAWRRRCYVAGTRPFYY